MHGIACWFDVLFDGSVQPRWLTTAPGQPTTHWCGWLVVQLELTTTMLVD